MGAKMTSHSLFRGSISTIGAIDCDLANHRTLDSRKTQAFLKIAHRVREGLKAGHSYDD